ncbi:MAG: pyridoxal-phosphate dependent enzyme [Rhodobacter sp.]|jgi:threonine dehydratase|nr:pyridoxal-phosphate dependent enzyme [Rhodobacter sp.]
MSRAEWLAGEARFIARGASEAVRFLREVASVPPSPVIRADALSQLLEEVVLLQMDAILPLGHSTKIRSVCGLLAEMAANTLSQASASDLASARRAVRAASSGEARPPFVLDTFAGLRLALDGATIALASSGSHAFATCQAARWLRQAGVAEARVKCWVAADISAYKLQQLHALGAEVEQSPDFSDAEAAALNFARTRQRCGERVLFMPTDPADRWWCAPLFNHKDGAPGFATAVIEAVSALERHGGRSVGERILYLPTSGGATWASCLGYLHRVGTLIPGPPVRVVAVDHEAARPVHASLASRSLVENYPIASGTTPINGLTQRSMSPYAFALADALALEPDEAVRSVSLAAAKLAQLLILGETGVLPEVAGAATLGMRLNELARRHADFAGRITICLAQLGVSELHQKLVAISNDDLASLGLPNQLFASPVTKPPPPATPSFETTSLHLVSGGNAHQVITSRAVAQLTALTEKNDEEAWTEQEFAQAACLAFACRYADPISDPALPDGLLPALDARLATVQAPGDDYALGLRLIRSRLSETMDIRSRPPL